MNMVKRINIRKCIGLIEKFIFSKYRYAKVIAKLLFCKTSSKLDNERNYIGG